ncbi:MAG: DUF4317 domain-containing protein [Clostridia bacterium]|nr:DUF4317 domain-containing protein [Clostridia bacterium]
MNEKEIGELRRSFRRDKTTATKVVGCFVNTSGNVISTFERSFGLCPEEEEEKYLALFRRAFSGAPGKTLIDLSFSSEKVEKGEEYALTKKLLDSALGDKEALNAFFRKIAGSVKSEENYVLLLTHSACDVPYRQNDGEKSELRFDVFSFITCLCCPMKTGKARLIYDPTEKALVNVPGESTLCAPLRAFTFPAFDNRCANLYGALYYTADAEDSGDDFAEAVFGKTELPLPAAEQGRSFKTVLAESLKEECSFEVVKNLHLAISGQVEEHKEQKDPEPLLLDRASVGDLLSDCGVGEEKCAAFREEYAKAFGAATELPPKNVDPVGKFEVRTPEIVIKVSKGSEHLIEKREIDGKPRLVIDAGNGVTVNGLAVT